MTAWRISLAALALMIVAGVCNSAEAGTWAVRVEMEHVATGQTYYPTLFSSPDKKEAANEFAWYEGLMKNDPAKFRSDVLNPLGVPPYYMPVRMHLVYLQCIMPTGH